MYNIQIFDVIYLRLGFSIIDNMDF